jgi:methyl-accepting chemotaxis protein
MAIATLAVKLSADIAEFRSEFRDATKAAQKFQDEFETTATKASALGNLIARGVEVVGRAVVQMGADLVNNASKLVDLANKTGLTTDSIQEFQHVAEQTGSSVDAFANAAFRLGVKLAGGSDSVQAAVHQLGLSFDDLRKKSPDEQFRIIASALGRMDDAQERNRLGLILFDRTFAGIASSVGQNYQVMADGAIKATRTQLEALDAAGEAWENYRRRVQTQATAALGSTVILGQAIRENLFSVFARGATQGPGGALQEIIGSFAKKVTDVEVASFKASIQSQKLGSSFAQQALAADKAAEALKKTTATTDRYRESVRTLADQLSGAALTSEVKKLSDATKLLTDKQKDSPEVMRRVADAALRLQEQGAELTNELFLITIETGRLQEAQAKGLIALDLTKLGFESVTGGIQESLKSLTAYADALNDPRLKGIPGLPDELPGISIPAPDLPEPPPPTFWEQFLPEPVSFLQKARSIAQSAVNVLANAIATGNWEAFKDDMARHVSAFMGAGIASAVDFLVPGLGTLLEPLFTAFSEKFIGLFDRNRGRDLVKDFAAGLGGFDALHRQLNQLGDEGERLWIQLTQGVGRNNPEQAQRAIDAVTAALGRQATQVRESQQAVTGLVQAHLGASVQIPAALQASIDKLVEMGVLTRENAAEILGLADTAKPSFAEIQRAAETLGVSVDGIGDAVQQIRFSEKAEEIVDAFKVLEAAGADMGAVFAGSVEKVQPLVDEALKFGRELPESLRPFLQSMVDAGLLVDETGQQLKDLSALNFAEPLTKKLDDLIVKIGELIDTLNGGLGGAIDNISRRRVEIPIAFRIEDERLGIDMDVPALASGGIVRRPTLALVGESGPEAVVPLSQLASNSGGGGTAILELDGRTIAEVLVPEIPGVVKRYGLA